MRLGAERQDIPVVWDAETLMRVCLPVSSLGGLAALLIPGFWRCQVPSASSSLSALFTASAAMRGSDESGPNLSHQNPPSDLAVHSIHVRDVIKE